MKNEFKHWILENIIQLSGFHFLYFLNVYSLFPFIFTNIQYSKKNFFSPFFCVKFSYSKVETWEIIFRCTFERVAGVFLNFFSPIFFFFTFELIDVCE